ncbi:MAG TPA: glycosyltransferase [Solirubrobacteraceae bacterium]|nr:glycosyltransferase [Solirubrobacteraceae bacterium]
MRRVLLVAPFPPTIDGRHGGSRALRGLAEGLAKTCEVGLVHTQEEGEGDAVLNASCSLLEAVPVPPDGRWMRRMRAAAGLVRGRSLWAASLAVPTVARRVAAVAERWRPDVVQVESVLGETLRAVGGAPLRVLTVHEPAEMRREGVSLRREGMALAHRVDGAVAVREQRRILSLAEAAVVFTPRDREIIARAAPPALELATIALGWDLPARPLDPLGSDPPSVVFVGSFIHPPNVDAALRLAKEILPLVRRERPDVHLELVGSRPPPEIRALAADGVRVAGDVPSVEPYLDRAAVVVAPIAIGGGMRVKVLEAMAAGKALVSSPRAAEGLSAQHGREILIADGVEQTAAAILRLVEDAPARAALGRAARAWAERELSWSAMAARYEELYSRLEDRRAASSARRG